MDHVVHWLLALICFAIFVCGTYPNCARLSRLDNHVQRTGNFDSMVTIIRFRENIVEFVSIGMRQFALEQRHSQQRGTLRLQQKQHYAVRLISMFLSATPTHPVSCCILKPRPTRHMRPVAFIPHAIHSHGSSIICGCSNLFPLSLLRKLIVERDGHIIR